MTDQRSAPDAAPALDTSLALDVCLAGCDEEYDDDDLGMQDAEREWCEQICDDLYGQDDWSDDDDE